MDKAQAMHLPSLHLPRSVLQALHPLLATPRNYIQWVTELSWL